MPQTVADRQTKRVLLVAAGSAAAFIGFTFLIYWQYFTNRGTFYDQRLDEGFAVLQLVFYSAMLLHVIGSYGVAAALSRWMRLRVRPTLAYVTVLFAILAVPVYLYVSAIHACATGESLPIPGLATCDD
ncbi:MAG: hypothetical protein IIC90_03065 [Chloroflexi bacterium]|nr:hypothetical protein [Chloroflexota bacterium]